MPPPRLVERNSAPELSREEKIDRFGDLELAKAQFQPKLDEYNALKREIEGWYAEAAADKPALAQGRRYSIQLSPKERRRKVTDPKRAFALLKRYVGAAKLVDVLAIPLKVVDQFIPEAFHPQFLVQERTGPRDLVAVPMLPPEKAA